MMENLERDHQQEMAQLHSQVRLSIQPMYTTEVLLFYVLWSFESFDVIHKCAQ